MKKIALVLFLFAGWYGNYLYRGHTPSISTTLSAYDDNNEIEVVQEYEEDEESEEDEENYVCDGRQYCSQMRSCSEAIFFIHNCPNTKMDGDGDDIPCERQLCGH